MKTCKKALAMILCLCLLASVLVFTASAADEPKTMAVALNAVKATKLSEKDNETVLQLQLSFGTPVAENDEAQEPAALPFNTVDKNAEIVIHEGTYVAVYTMMYDIMSNTEQEILEKSTIAKAKPVSYENGVLTVDVYSKDGKEGAKMVGITVDGFIENFGLFLFDVPTGLLKDSTGSTVNDGNVYTVSSVEGLAVRTLKLPSLAKGVLKDYMDGNEIGLITKALRLLPILPLELMITIVRLNRIYKVYGMSAYKMCFDILRALQKALPYLIVGLAEII